MTGATQRWQRGNSVLDRVRRLLNEGFSKETIRARMIAEGVKPNVIKTYLNDLMADDELPAWVEKACQACDAHLADLQREHGQRECA